MKKVLVALACCTFFEHSFTMNLPEEFDDESAKNVAERVQYWNRIGQYNKLCDRNGKGELACCTFFEHSFTMNLPEEFDDESAKNVAERVQYWNRIGQYNKLCDRNGKGELACCTFFEHSFTMNLPEEFDDKSAKNVAEEVRYWDRMDQYNKLCGRNRKGELACCAFFECSFTMNLPEEFDDKSAKNVAEEVRYWDRIDQYNKLCGRNRKGEIANNTIIHYHGKSRPYKEWRAKQCVEQFRVEIGWKFPEDTLQAFPEYLETESELKLAQKEFDEKIKELRSYQSFNWQKAQTLIGWIYENFPSDMPVTNELIQLANALDDNIYEWIGTLLESLDPVFENLDNWNDRKKCVLSTPTFCSRGFLRIAYDGITTQQLMENSPAALEIFHAEFLKLRELNIPIVLDLLKKISDFWTDPAFLSKKDEFLWFCYRYFLKEDFALEPYIICGYCEEGSWMAEDMDLFEECMNLKIKIEQLSNKLSFLRHIYSPEEKHKRVQKRIQDLMNQEVKSASRPLTDEENLNFAPLMNLAHEYELMNAVSLTPKH